MPNKLFFTPGPSQLYPNVPFHLQRAIREDIPSISHRSSRFQDLMKTTRQNLRDLLDLPDNFEILFTSSANEIWERIIQNLVEESSHHFVNGAFSKKFFNFSQQYKKSSTKTEAAEGKEFDSFSVPKSAELISVTYNETSTGYAFDANNLETLRTENPDKLISTDIVSATPSVPLNFNHVDTAYFSVQKCFGLPAGLGVWLVNDACLNKAERLASKGKIIGSYHSLPSLFKQGQNNQTPETPNVLGIYLLNHVLEDMLQRGLKYIRNETIYKSTILYQAYEDIDRMKSFVENKSNRSKTVCVAELSDGNTDLIQHFDKKGIVIGKGYGSFKENHIRVANFPTHSKEQVEMLVDMLTDFYKR